MIYDNKMHSELCSVSFGKCICKRFEIIYQNKAEQGQVLLSPGVSSTDICAHVYR